MVHLETFLIVHNQFKSEISNVEAMQAIQTNRLS